MREFPGAFFNCPGSVADCTVQLSNTFSCNDLVQVRSLHQHLVANFESIESIIKQFDAERKANLQFQMLKTYTRMVERLLVFIHASRSGNWSLHLSATEELIQDITSMDRIKYHRLLPVYLAEMHNLQNTDPIIWEAFQQGGFSVAKTSIPFTAIGMDHAGEQINKILKIEGGIVGISRNENARTRYFLTAPIIAQIIANTKESCGVNEGKAKVHHQLTSAYTKRQNEMKGKIIQVMEHCNVNFDVKEDSNLRNFVTNQVFGDEVKRDMLAVEDIGRKAYKLFVQERLTGGVSIWAPMKKLNLHLACNANKKKLEKIEHTVIELKGQRESFSR